MAESPGLVEFFGMEASDYLQRLDALVSKPTLDPDEFLRVARALRGSALMANQQVIAASAAGFEHVAKAVREGRRQWDARMQQVVVRAVDDFKVLVRRLREWTAEDDDRARGIGASLEAVAGAAPAQPAAAGPADARARALIAQQGASLASTLGSAAQSLEADPKAQGALRAVLQVIQPLRGIASLVDYPPLPDILDAIERLIGEVRREPRPPGGLPNALEAASLAIARAAREIAAEGRAEPAAPELDDLVNRLAAVMGLDSAVLPIEALFFDDAGPHTLESGIVPAAPIPPGGPELVPHGEFLQQAADSIERARSTAERELRAQALLGTFRALAAGGDGPLAEAAATFGRAGRDALAYRWASLRTKDFVALLRRAGDALSAAGRIEEPRLATALSSVSATLREAVFAAAAARVSRPAAAPAAESSVAAAAQLAPEATDGDTPDLAGGYARYERFVTALGLANPSVDALLAGPPVLPAPARPRPAPAAPRPAAPSPARRTPVSARAHSPGAEAEVPIGALLYSGPAALERALALRDDVRRALESPIPDADAVRELVEEIFDLVQLGQTRGG